MPSRFISFLIANFDVCADAFSTGEHIRRWSTFRFVCTLYSGQKIISSYLFSTLPKLQIAFLSFYDEKQALLTLRHPHVTSFFPTSELTSSYLCTFALTYTSFSLAKQHLSEQQKSHFTDFAKTAD